MSEELRGALLLFAGLLFVAFMLLKVLPARFRDGASRLAKSDLADAQRRARDRALTLEARAAALREAALIALEQLGRTGLAASYARRAERLDPGSGEGVPLLARILRRGSRLSALERFLWRRLGQSEGTTLSSSRALAELIALYEGALKRPEVAIALRKLSAQNNEGAGRP